LIKKYLWVALLVLPFMVNGQSWQGKFEQLGDLLPTPNSYRTAAGAPGYKYWQQKADYKINATLDEATLLLTGEEQITFHNNSPHQLKYLWFQLDQNIRNKNSISFLSQTNEIDGDMEAEQIMSLTNNYFYQGGYTIGSVTSLAGIPLSYTVNQTMMRVDLPEVLNPHDMVVLNISWQYNMYDRLSIDGRGGYEYFPKDDNYIFTLAQWYPRLAVYDDVEGWQNKQFLGGGEFALTFGDYDVNITVPADHVVAATGVLQNKHEVLTQTELNRMNKAESANTPVFIITEKEARKKEKTKSNENKTWHFVASNVRDFALASSRKFIWDAMVVPLATTTPMAMSFFPKEGNPLWERHSTLAVANALITYSHRTFDYPYPVAISVHTADQGMEYPMICFNRGRPNANGKYSPWLLQDMVSVIVHEVGHNYFPMIVNSDERQWTWMDEGLNTFLENLTLTEHYPQLHPTWGTAKSVTDYMKGNPDYIRPIMTNSEQIIQFGNNGYGKPSAALNVLRDVVMGADLFDFAFKTYAQRWAFKRPMPADFFRTMEDASAVDLDWFWRGWFFTTDYVDLNIKNINWYKVEDAFTDDGESVATDLLEKNNDLDTVPTKFFLTQASNHWYSEFMNTIDDSTVLNHSAGNNVYEITFENLGGLVTPIIISWTFTDGSSELEKLPAEIWRKNENSVTKVFIKRKQVKTVQIDPYQMTADAYLYNNFYPRQVLDTRFEQFKEDD